MRAGCLFFIIAFSPGKANPSLERRPQRRLLSALSRRVPLDTSRCCKDEREDEGSEGDDAQPPSIPEDVANAGANGCEHDSRHEGGRRGAYADDGACAVVQGASRPRGSATYDPWKGASATHDPPREVSDVGGWADDWLMMCNGTSRAGEALRRHEMVETKGRSCGKDAVSTMRGDGGAVCARARVVAKTKGIRGCPGRGAVVVGLRETTGIRESQRMHKGRHPGGSVPVSLKGKADFASIGATLHAGETVMSSMWMWTGEAGACARGGDCGVRAAWLQRTPERVDHGVQGTLKCRRYAGSRQARARRAVVYGRRLGTAPCARYGHMRADMHASMEHPSYLTQDLHGTEHRRTSVEVTSSRKPERRWGGVHRPRFRRCGGRAGFVLISAMGRSTVVDAPSPATQTAARRFCGQLHTRALPRTVTGTTQGVLPFPVPNPVPVENARGGIIRVLITRPPRPSHGTHVEMYVEVPCSDARRMRVCPLVASAMRCNYGSLTTIISKPGSVQCFCDLNEPFAQMNGRSEQNDVNEKLRTTSDRASSSFLLFESHSTAYELVSRPTAPRTRSRRARQLKLVSLGWDKALAFHCHVCLPLPLALVWPPIGSLATLHSQSVHSTQPKVSETLASKARVTNLLSLESTVDTLPPPAAG
ncbi:hypothetical protein DFH06DRAFT_1136832 [Mycena polygramma]|nr:hypothetical protein DFH06DRAFT_1136832 [Mycena polygramma]